MISFESERSLSDNYLYTQSDVNLSFDLHLHTSYEYIYVEEGEINIEIEGVDYIVKSNESCIILPNQIHSYKTKNYSKTKLVIFAISYAYDFYNYTKNKYAKKPVFVNDNTFDVFGILNEDIKNEFRLKSLFYHLLYNFSKDTTFEIKNSKSQQVIENILTYAEKQYSQDISLKDFAREFSYNYNYISNMINNTLHINFMTLINVHRINKAKFLISTTNKSFYEIASECGYNSIRSFNRNFKNLTSISPTEYKNINNLQ